MNKTFLKKMKESLLEQKRELLKQAADREVEVDTEGDETDEIQANILIDLTNQLNTRNSTKLAQIETALKRIEDKTYGLCQDCEEPIPEKRLLSNPYFQTCVTCAEEREAEEKQRKKF
jgi:DnaK suppressor protein